MFCSDCAKEFAIGQKIWNVSWNVESFDDDDSITVHRYENIALYCMACVQLRDLSDITVARKY
jgi:hypothetical protein